MSYRAGLLRRAALAALVLSATASGAHAQSVWRVDDEAPPGGDGASWATAFASLDDAFDAAVPGDQVWVAEGVYRPTKLWNVNDPRSAVFDLPDFVEVYGGFAGGEASLDERAGLFDATVLSGDLGVPGDDSDNAYRVARFASDFNQHADARLDGFRITGGRGEAGHRGGGLHLTAGQGPNSWAILELANCSVVDNASERGGGVAVDNFSRLRVLRCRFEDNRATLYGGGLWCLAAWTWSVDSRWSGNRAAFDGGAVWTNSNEPQSMRFVNDVFHDNVARRGGVAFLGSSPPVVGGFASFRHCTLAYNRAIDGGAVHAVAGARLRVRNSVLWGNRAALYPAIFPPVGSNNVRVEYSDVEGGFPGEGNLAVDPRFVDAFGRDLHTLAGSPVHDAASVEWIPKDHNDVDGDGVAGEDLPLDHDDGRRRADDPQVPDVGDDLPAPDMGAYEYTTAGA